MPPEGTQRQRDTTQSLVQTRDRDPDPQEDRVPQEEGPMRGKSIGDLHPSMNQLRRKSKGNRSWRLKG